jgi:K+-transporting ATPase KdpF subunit
MDISPLKNISGVGINQDRMSLDFVIAGIVVVGLLIYLAYTLIYPEKF